MPTQVNWRFRQLCNAMFYDGLPSKFVCAGAGPPLGFHVGHRAGLIQAVDAIGGDRGVDAQGVLGVQDFIVTPHGSGMIGQLIDGVNHGVRRPGSWSG